MPETRAQSLQDARKGAIRYSVGISDVQAFYGPGGEGGMRPNERALFNEGAVAVPFWVRDPIRHIWYIGEISLYDVDRVVWEIGQVYGNREAAHWIEGHRAAYLRGLVEGFSVEGGEE